jgi:beta-phosphoglucomutase-like phosphatase (HAD superfamily)
MQAGPRDKLRELAAGADGAAIIWDFDGVVAHSEPLHEESYRLLAQKRSYDLKPDFFSVLVGHTEQWIWNSLISSGFPATAEELPELINERGPVVASLARRDLKPSWLATDLMPIFKASARSQTIVSNGDPDLIAALLVDWGLSDFVWIARRGPGEDKDFIFRRNCSPPAVVLEDSDRFLLLGRELGATTVGVRHSHNPHAKLPADLTVELEGQDISQRSARDR